MKIKIKTLGCKVNQYEGQAISERFLLAGCQVTNKAADLYVINTCTVTKNADQKSKKAILQAKKENPKAKIIATGCMTENKKTYALLEKTEVDQIILQKNKHNLVDILLNSPKSKSNSKNLWNLKIKNYPRKRAFVKIQDGCDLFCTFCKIPYLRPKPTSRKKQYIIDEVKKLSPLHKEIVFCGINSTLYGKDLNPKVRLSSLVKEVLKLKCLGRLRLSSLQPLHIDSALINLLSHPKMCPHLHLSFQYGHDKILKAMNKKETVKLYLKKVEAIKKTNPHTAISCDIMVGFPGETEDTFGKTIDFLKKVKPMRTHIFCFSPREKTPLSASPTLDPVILKKRYQLINNLTKNFFIEYCHNFLDKTLEMIAEERKKGLIIGHTQNYIKVRLKEPKNKKKPGLKLGSLIKVKITKIDKNGQVFARLA